MAGYTAMGFSDWSRARERRGLQGQAGRSERIETGVRGPGKGTAMPQNLAQAGNYSALG